MTPRLKPARSTRLAAAAVAAAALIATAGWTSAPAQSDPSSDCPLPSPVGDLVANQPVTGLTVLSGTAPTEFSGKVLGVLEDGIAPDLDMILIQVTAPTEVTSLGIWQGMSGSPVYDADHKLIGAVAYGLGTGPSTIAGVTPAAEMQRMVSGANTPAAPTPETVSIPRAMASRMVASGAASAAEVGSGMHQLQLPFSVSGVSTRRMAKLASLYKMGDMHVMAAAAGPTSSQQIPVTTGGNIAAAMSYGSVTAAAIGTATMVCGNEVVGFGHPMNFTGPSQMSLHGANAITIQDDPTVAGFKVANLGAPVGTVDQDRLAGIHGVFGPLPVDAPVTSHAHLGSLERTAESHVVVPEIFTQVAFSNMLGIQDRVMDRTGGGAGWATWTVKGTHDGTPFHYQRKDLYADPSDLSSAMAVTLADQLSTLEENGVEDVTFSSVDTDSTVDRAYATWTIARTQLWRNGRWATLRPGFPADLRAGRNAAVKVLLTSKQVAPRTLVVRVAVPRRALGHRGTLQVFGGNDGAPVDEFFSSGFDFSDGEPAPSVSVKDLVKQFQDAPHHNEVRAVVDFPGAPLASAPRPGIRSLLRVVGGGLTVPVRAVR